jgi:hypothetical protein
MTTKKTKWGSTIPVKAGGRLCGGLAVMQDASRQRMLRLVRNAGLMQFSLQRDLAAMSAVRAVEEYEIGW